MDIQQMIRDIRTRMIGELVDKYSNSFEPLCRILANWFAAVWQNIERTTGPEIEGQKAQFDAARTKHATETETFYRNTNTEALERLKTKFKTAIKNRRRYEVNRRDRLEQLGELLLDLGYRLRMQLVGMAGVDNTHIEIPRHSRARIVGIVTLMIAGALIVMGIEVLVGNKIWEWAADPDTAAGLTAATVLGFTGLGALSMRHLKRVMTVWDAQRAYRRRYGREGQQEGFHVFPPSSTDKMAGLGGLGLLFVMSIALLLARTIAVQDQSDLGGVYATVGLLFVVIVVCLGDLVLNLGHTKGQYQRLDRLQNQLATAQDELASFQNPNNDPYRQEMLAAINEYNATMDDAEQQIEAEASRLEQIRQELVERMTRYSEFWDALVDGFIDCINDLSLRVDQKWAVDRASMAACELDNDRMLMLLTSVVAPRFYDANFLTELFRHRFEANVPPGVRQEDFAAVFAQAMAEAGLPIVTRNAGSAVAMPAGNVRALEAGHPVVEGQVAGS